MKPTQPTNFTTFLIVSYCPILGIRYLGLMTTSNYKSNIEYKNNKIKQIQKMQIVNNHFSRQKR